MDGEWHYCGCLRPERRTCQGHAHGSETEGEPRSAVCELSPLRVADLYSRWQVLARNLSQLRHAADRVRRPSRAAQPRADGGRAARPGPQGARSGASRARHARPLDRERGARAPPAAGERAGHQLRQARCARAHGCDRIGRLRGGRERLRGGARRRRGVQARPPRRQPGARLRLGPVAARADDRAVGHREPRRYDRVVRDARQLTPAPRISTASSATAVGVRPTRTPWASSASAFAWAVPDEPDTIAPAWPMVLPGGAVKPAMYASTGFDTFSAM